MGRVRIPSIDVVLPGYISDLDIKEGKAYCTLVTYTPYGINSHRLLVCFIWTRKGRR